MHGETIKKNATLLFHYHVTPLLTDGELQWGKHVSPINAKPHYEHLCGTRLPMPAIALN